MNRAISQMALVEMNEGTAIIEVPDLIPLKILDVQATIQTLYPRDTHN